MVKKAGITHFRKFTIPYTFQLKINIFFSAFLLITIPLKLIILNEQLYLLSIGLLSKTYNHAEKHDT